MNKKILSLLLVLSFFTSFFSLACKKDDKVEDNSDKKSSSQEENKSSQESENRSGEDKEEKIDKNYIKDFIGKNGNILVDARSTSSYSGWALNGDKRGGHIKGAVDFSKDWLDCEYDDAKNLEKKTREEVLQEAMKNKGIETDKNIIVYDSDGKSAQAVADYFKKQGINNVKTYCASDWIEDESMPMESYPNYKLYLPVEVVNELSEGKDTEEFKGKKDIKIFDVGWGNEEESGYLEGHVKGAVHINTDSFEPPKEIKPGVTEWMLTDDKSLLKLLLENGISKDTTVISTGSEPMAAARFAVILKYMGVEDVRVMAGGLVDYKLRGFELSKESVKPQAISSFGTDKVPMNPDWIESIDELKEDLKKKDFTLVDNRTWEEYIGETSGYDYHKIKGRIEGAVYGCAGLKSSSSVYYYRNVDKTMRNGYEILQMWKDLNINLDNRLAFMCGSGWRAAEILWDARVMGLENTTLYSDGWIGWSNRGNPFVTGDPTKK